MPRGQNLRRIRFVATTCSLIFAAMLFTANANAEHTRSWRQSTYEEFLKGTSNGVTVRSDGRLELSPKFTLLADADASFLWTLRADPKGVLYAAGGSPAKVFRFDANGKPTKAFESTDLAVQAIAFDSKGNLYVGTSPDGKVYRVTAGGEKSVFFDPKTKYIWDLAFGSDGTLYVATGDKGQIFAVSPDGKSELYYASDEAHIRVLAFDGKGNLLVGTEPSGRVLRVTKIANAGSAQRERERADCRRFCVVRDVEARNHSARRRGGWERLCCRDRRKAACWLAGATIISTAGGTTTITGGGVIGGGTGQAQSPFVPFPPLLSGSIYKIAARRSAGRALDFPRRCSLFARTHRRRSPARRHWQQWRAARRRWPRRFRATRKAGSAQITGITRGPNGKIFLCTANPGKVFSVGPEYEPEGTYESRSFDAGFFQNGDASIGGVRRRPLRIRRALRANRAWNFSSAPGIRKTRQRMVTLVRAIRETKRG